MDKVFNHDNDKDVLNARAFDFHEALINGQPNVFVYNILKRLSGHPA